MPVRISSTTVGSKSTMTQRGTGLPAPVSEKKRNECVIAAHGFCREQFGHQFGYCARAPSMRYQLTHQPGQCGCKSLLYGSRNVHVQCAIAAQGRRHRRDNLAEQPVQVGVRRALDIQIPSADVVKCLVVVHDGDICVLHYECTHKTVCRAPRQPWQFAGKTKR